MNNYFLYSNIQILVIVNEVVFIVVFVIVVVVAFGRLRHVTAVDDVQVPDALEKDVSKKSRRGRNNTKSFILAVTHIM